jgi:tetratricopeptide (TPR) repeat protein
VTSIWGNRELLYWANLHPDSPRAIHTVAGAYLKAGKIADAQQFYHTAYTRNPQLSSVAMQGLQLRCYANDRDAFQTQQQTMLRTLSNSHHSGLAIQSLAAILRLHQAENCPHVGLPDIHALITSLQENPAFQSASSRSNLHTIRAETFLAQGDLISARIEYKHALDARPDPRLVASLFTLIKHLEGPDAARTFALDMERHIPSRNPWVREHWKKVIRNLLAFQQ